MNDHSCPKGTVPCHTWRMIRAMEEDQNLKRPAVPGRRAPAAAQAEEARPVPAEPEKTEAKKAEPKKAEPKKAETKKTEPKKAEAKKTEAKKSEAKKAEPKKTEPKKTETRKAAPKKAPAEAVSPFEAGMAQWGDELARLYRDVFHGDLAAWDALTTLLRQGLENRSAALRARDDRRAADSRWYLRRELLGMADDAGRFAGALPAVAQHLDYLKECGVGLLCLTGAGDAEELAALAAACEGREICLALPLEAPAPQDAAGFHRWTAEVLRLAGLGADALCLGDLSPLSHQVVRMTRLVCQLVCSGVLLLGKAPADSGAAFLGSEAQPECHLLCRDNGPVLFHTLATGDVALLRRQTEAELAAGGRFLNRLHGDGGLAWELDYGWLKEHCGADEGPHRQYLNDWATGRFPGSNSRAELCREGRVWGTTASLCGVEAADYEQNYIKLERAVACDLLLHAFLLTQSGLPLLTSGDEVGQLNDYSRKEDPRTLTQGAFQWELAQLRTDSESRQGKQFQGLRRLEQLRAAEPAFDSRADLWTFDTGNPHVLGLGRWYEGRKLVALFNFSGDFVSAGAPEGGAFEELIYGGHYDELGHVELYPFGFVWLLQQEA